MCKLVQPAGDRSESYRAGFLAVQSKTATATDQHPEGSQANREWKHGYKRAQDECLDFAFVRRQRISQPVWARDKHRVLTNLSRRSLEPFVHTTTINKNASVELSQVVGTEHPDYGGMSWLEMLSRGKKMRSNLNLLLNNPGYYLATMPNDNQPSYYTQDGSSIFIVGDGNHRTCIARFFLAERGLSQLHGVTITHDQIDHELLRLYRRLKTAVDKTGTVARVQPDRSSISEERHQARETYRYEPFLVWRDWKTQRAERLDRNQVRERVEALEVKARRQAFRDRLKTRVKSFMGG